MKRDKLESLSLGCPQHEAMHSLAIGSVFVVAFKVKPFERSAVFFLSHFVTEVMKLAFLKGAAYACPKRSDPY
jgi:hypothetical protein